MMHRLYLIAFSLVGFFSGKSQDSQQPFPGQGRHIHSLNGEDWELVSARSGVGEAQGFYKNGYPQKDIISAKVPGDIHWDLERAGKLPDLFIAMNAKKAYDLPLQEWWYRKSFVVADTWKHKQIRLHFAAVDYAAKVWINGQYLGRHEGQFTPFEFDVTDNVKIGAPNELIILIEPAPENIIKKLFAPRTQINRQYAMDEVSNTLKYWKCRTMSGWDWGTPLWTMGIWQNVTLIASDQLFLDRLLIQTETHKPYTKAKLHTTVDIHTKNPKEVTLTYTVPSLRPGFAKRSVSKIIKAGDGNQRITFSLDIKNPALWWPNGYGAQNIYELTVSANDKKTGKLLDRISTKFGVRDIKIVANPDADNYKEMTWYSHAAPVGSGKKDIPKDSLSGYLVRINDMPVFLHGGNWLPPDLLYGRPGKKEYTHLIRMAALANFNAFRVWGGGLIEKQEFYDLCDQYGILVFQEMPHAGALPLETPQILANAAAEQQQVMPLLINHPSVFRYGFGNELYITRQTSLQVKQFEDICKELDSSRHVIGADPVCEYQRHGPHWFDFNSEYSVYNTGYPLTVGPDNPVEWTEYGASGASSVTTLKRIIPKENLWPISSKDSVWQWHNGFEAYTTSDWLKPEIYHPLFGKPANLENEVKVSQFSQAEGLRYANQSHRRAKWHRSGSFMWTLNEPWPNAAHGSIVEYYGLPKQALYYTRHSYAQVDISTIYNSMLLNSGDTLKLPVFATSARKVKISGKLKIVIMDLDGKVHYRDDKNLQIDPLSSSQVTQINFATNKEWNNKVLLVRFDLLGQNDNTIASETYTFSVGGVIRGGNRKAYMYSMLEAPETQLQFDVKYHNKTQWGSDEMNCYRAKLKNTSEVPALFVQLKCDRKPNEVYFKDNYFILLPGEEKKVDILVVPGIGFGDTAPGVGVSAWNLYR